MRLLVESAVSRSLGLLVILLGDGINNIDNSRPTVCQLSTSEFSRHVNDRDFDGMTPFHLAAARGHVHLVTWLIDHGAKFLLDRSGGTALHLAAANGKLEVDVLIVRS